MIFLATNLRYLRETKGLTQGQLAGMIGVKPNTISNYETGYSSPDFELLGKIIEILDTDAHTILYTDLCTGTPVRRVSDVRSPYNAGKKREEEDGRLEEMRRDIESLKTAMSRLLDEKDH